MSFAKYAQFYKDNGFFAGSKIKTTVTDGTFVGEQLVLSKGNTILKTTTIPTSGKVEFFTDESGELLLSADNGTSTISGSVTITSYATYNVTLHGEASDNKREAYANDVTMNGDTAEATVAYTGDKSSMSIVVSDHKLIKAQIDGEKIKITDGGYDKKGKCSITATIAETENYTSADVTFYVNKLTGTYGDWSTADDEMISSMIAQADAGEIDLADFWNIGDTRRVHLNAIEAGEEVAEQVEQDIDLVIMHNPLGDSKYMLTTPTVGNRYQPHFIIGTKDCLENKSVMGYFAKGVTVTYSTGYSYTYNSYMPIDATQNAELIDFLNDEFINALPEFLRNNLKSTNRRYVCAGGNQNETLYNGKASYTSMGTKTHKVSLFNLKELGLLSDVRSSNIRPYLPSGVGVYGKTGEASSTNDGNRMVSQTNDNVNNCGTKFSYFNENSIIKGKGIDGEVVDYLLADAFMLSYRYSSSYQAGYSTAFYIGSDGVLSTNDLADAGTRTKLRGVSPIMFI